MSDEYDTYPRRNRHVLISTIIRVVIISLPSALMTSGIILARLTMARCVCRQSVNLLMPSLLVYRHIIPIPMC